MNREEKLITDYIIETVHAVHPEYGLVAEEKLDYIKIYMPDGYNVNSAILAMVHFGVKSRYIKLRPEGLGKDQKKALTAMVDKKGIAKINSWDDVKKFEEYFVPIADYLWQVYEIEKFRELSANRPKSELLDALGIGITFDGVGTRIGQKEE